MEGLLTSLQEDFWPPPWPTAASMFPGGSDLDTQANLVLLSLALSCFTDVVFLKADPSPAKKVATSFSAILHCDGLVPNPPVSVSRLRTGPGKEESQVSGWPCLLGECQCLLTAGSVF